MRLKDYMPVGTWGGVSLEYDPQSKTISVCFYPIGMEGEGYVKQTFRDGDIRKPAYELNKMKNPFNVSVLLFTSVRLSVLDGRVELVGHEAGPKLRFLLLDKRVNGTWCEVEFDTNDE